jgi:hypothetical protein
MIVVVVAVHVGDPQRDFENRGGQDHRVTPGRKTGKEHGTDLLSTIP